MIWSVNDLTLSSVGCETFGIEGLFSFEAMAFDFKGHTQKRGCGL